METTETIANIREIVVQARTGGKTIGLVPTMGALHEGHLSLIRRCRQECDFTVVSIFVNPAQFGPSEDFDSYPRTFEADSAACRDLGVDLIFAPAVLEMYPSENLTWIDIDRIGDHLCGAARPGFFRGVCTVVAKLFNIIQPDVAYFGEKDAQQLAVITRMVADLNLPLEIRGCPIVRESDGLAMSSRNQYLDPEQRRQAVCLFQALEHARQLIENGQTDSAVLIDAMKAIIEKQPQPCIDYLTIVDRDLMQPLPKIDRPARIALAVHLGPARLIDNIAVDPPMKKP
jgi:pantoate--beta-alanine ligase